MIGQRRKTIVISFFMLLFVLGFFCIPHFIGKSDKQGDLYNETEISMYEYLFSSDSEVLPKDPWGNDYIKAKIEIGQHTCVLLYSYGSDKSVGTTTGIGVDLYKIGNCKITKGGPNSLVEN